MLKCTKFSKIRIPQSFTFKMPWNSAKFSGILYIAQKIPYSAGSQKTTSVDNLSATGLTLMFRQLERLQSLDLSHCPDLREVQTAAFHNNLDLRLVIKGRGNYTFITDFFN
jgi:hypothetical protein